MATPSDQRSEIGCDIRNSEGQSIHRTLPPTWRFTHDNADTTKISISYENRIDHSFPHVIVISGAAEDVNTYTASNDIRLIPEGDVEPISPTIEEPLPPPVDQDPIIRAPDDGLVQTSPQTRFTTIQADNEGCCYYVCHPDENSTSNTDWGWIEETQHACINPEGSRYSGISCDNPVASCQSGQR